MKEIKEIHQKGLITLENVPIERGFIGDFGLQTAADGRVWVCINGIAFLRFKPEGMGFAEDPPDKVTYEVRG